MTFNKAISIKLENSFLHHIYIHYTPFTTLILQTLCYQNNPSYAYLRFECSLLLKIYFSRSSQSQVNSFSQGRKLSSTSKTKKLQFLKKLQQSLSAPPPPHKKKAYFKAFETFQCLHHMETQLTISWVLFTLHYPALASELQNKLQ